MNTCFLKSVLPEYTFVDFYLNHTLLAPDGVILHNTSSLYIGFLYFGISRIHIARCLHVLFSAVPLYYFLSSCVTSPARLHNMVCSLSRAHETAGRWAAVGVSPAPAGNLLRLLSPSERGRRQGQQEEAQEGQEVQAGQVRRAAGGRAGRRLCAQQGGRCVH